MTYYTEIWKSRQKKTKSEVLGERRYWKKGIRRTENLKDKKDAHETVHKRATKKIIGIQSYFFYRPEVVKICQNFILLFNFFYFRSTFLQFLEYGTVIQ